ncbi:hypothetical protein [Micromonospora endolithica]|uniref:hypothetical protein n=1 Tax=Micromonospora endolithica TaxID=230091 RepID=UPI001EDD1137|nr:hypothetical protein [Micromonospora endolithica]
MPRTHRWHIVYAFGLLTLLCGAATLVVVAREPARSSAHLTAPVPAPEITVVDEDPSEVDEDAFGDPFAEPFAFGEPDALDESDGFGAPGTGPGPSSGPATEPSSGPDDVAHGGRHSPENVRRSLFWSGVFGLAISLAGLGLVGTRRRMW